ncbi:hypothetical protein [Szabonella alba]|uniref:Curlin associated repeat-containing protein n=1 Tax=Szabonella alba TaxID=2804194 RepID=A0A8K0VBJ4_9RHOB|nr:hypothetical protein [Szabonella alba]MBL4918893.1 hypothetical protein [Szabonella alba]
MAFLLSMPVAGQTQNIENSTVIDQNGADNAAVVDQIGLGNIAGTEDLILFQEGYHNSLVIRQDGNANQIGTTGSGLLQRNSFGRFDSQNRATIRQQGNNNRVDEVVQRVLGPVPTDANSLTIEQNGGDGNVIQRIDQNQQSGMPGQSADVTMTGFGNRIDMLQQESASDLLDESNDVFLLITGDNNGTTALRGYAGFTGAIASTLIQRRGTEDTGANGNLANLEILGNSNAFGILQRGRINRTGAIVITGDGNAIGIEQDGTENDIVLSLVEGNDNEIGLSQLGTNVAILSLQGSSSRNKVLIDQMGTNDALTEIAGDRNVITTRQGLEAGLGGTNQAETRVTGDDNRADLLQSGRNSALILIEGNGNNNTTGFSMDLADLAVGSYEQRGFGNSASVAVLGDANMSALLQNGLDNSILLSVQGNENEAVLRQIGNGNAAGLTQNGIANIALIQQ